MVTTKFYLDCRAIKKGKPAPLKIAITKKGVTAHISLNISLLPSQWDNKSQKIKDHPKKQFLNAYIVRRKTEVDETILRLIERGMLSGLKSCQVKDAILAELEPEESNPATIRTFAKRFELFMNTKSDRTKEIYMATYRKVKAFSNRKFETLRFEDITKDWLTRFDAFLAETSKSRNARNIHLRNIRSVFNDAIDNEITTAYPFRRYKIRAEVTRKRALTVEQLQMIFDTELPDWLEKYRQFFKLSFLLIGINVVDLCNLNEIENGRIYYKRSKTHRQYSIKVEPEALEIINKYRGKKNLLCMMDTVQNYRNFYNRFMIALNTIKDIVNKETHANIKELTTYWARHSWATIARKIGVSKDDIALALGHSNGHEVTDIYIDEDLEKIDLANRKVLDWVLNNKR